MDEDQMQAQIDELKEKALTARFAALENRLTAIEEERKRVVGWAIKAFALVAIYIFKDPITRLWEMMK